MKLTRIEPPPAPPPSYMLELTYGDLERLCSLVDFPRWDTQSDSTRQWLESLSNSILEFKDHVTAKVHFNSNQTSF